VSYRSLGAPLVSGATASINSIDFYLSKNKKPRLLFKKTLRNFDHQFQMNKQELEQEIKDLIIKSLDLEDISASEIDSTAPLFVTGLGLDSIDALELGIALKKKYNLTLKEDGGDNKKHFYSVSTLADFIIDQTSPK